MIATSKYIQTSPNPIRNVFHFIKRTLVLKLNDIGDIRLDIDASGQVEKDELDSTGPNAKYSNVYLGTPHSTLDIIFHALKIDHEKFDFVDFGSGKGRVICRAAKHPFNKIYGVELSKSLHESACENISKSSADFADRIVTVNDDVISFKLPDNPLVLFNFSSFDENVLEALIKKINGDIKQNKRECYFVYIRPKFEKTLLENSNFEITQLPITVKILMRIFSPWQFAVYKMKDG